jgi:hypothetical protein
LNVALLRCLLLFITACYQEQQQQAGDDPNWFCIHDASPYVQPMIE